MWFMILAFLVFMLLALLALPLARVRYVILGLMHRFLHLGLLACVVLSAVFFFAPSHVPAWLAEHTQPAINWLGQAGPDGWAGFGWLPLCAAFVLASLPVLAFIDAVQRLTGLVLVGRAFSHLYLAARQSAKMHGADGVHTEEKAGDFAAAERAARKITGQHAAKRRPLIDLLSS